MTEMRIVDPAGKGYNQSIIFAQPSRCQQTQLIAVRCRWMSQTTENHLSVLMRAGMNGDQISYRKFLQDIVPFIRRQIDRVMPYGVAAEKEDIAQDILFAIHQKRHTWRMDQPVLPWVGAISRYRTIDHLRRLGRQKTTSLDDHGDDISVYLSDPSDAIDLANMVGKLSGQIGKVTRAIGIEGKDIETTAMELDMTKNAVRIAFHRGLKQLDAIRQTSMKGRQYDKN
jgi:RNA polymerase sigma-70 factor (ECF subfamily)